MAYISTRVLPHVHQMEQTRWSGPMEQWQRLCSAGLRWSRLAVMEALHAALYAVCFAEAHAMARIWYRYCRCTVRQRTEAAAPKKARGRSMHRREGEGKRQRLPPAKAAAPAARSPYGVHTRTYARPTLVMDQGCTISGSRGGGPGHLPRSSACGRLELSAERGQGLHAHRTPAVKPALPVHRAAGRGCPAALMCLQQWSEVRTSAAGHWQRAACFGALA
jgi:hypothetical protein